MTINSIIIEALQLAMAIFQKQILNLRWDEMCDDHSVANEILYIFEGNV